MHRFFFFLFFISFSTRPALPFPKGDAKPTVTRLSGKQPGLDTAFTDIFYIFFFGSEYQPPPRLPPAATLIRFISFHSVCSAFCPPPAPPSTPSPNPPLAPAFSIASSFPKPASGGHPSLPPRPRWATHPRGAQVKELGGFSKADPVLPHFFPPNRVQLRAARRGRFLAAVWLLSRE